MSPRLTHVCLLTTFVFALTTARADESVYDPVTDPGLGFNVVSWWNFGSQGASIWENAVQRMYDAGFREVSLAPVRYVTPGTGVIATTSQRGPALSHVEAAVVRAKSLGMRVTLNPFVELENFSTWRGFYDPAPGTAEADQFWNDYQAYLVDVAQIGAAHGVDAMNVGTELKTIVRNTGHNAAWDAVINAVDAAYAGPLGYAANWDNFKNANLTAAIWEHPAIDFIGIDAYFRVVSSNEADSSGSYPDAAFLDLVQNRWTNQLDQDILPFAAGRKSGEGMPVVFTEYGLTPFNRSVAINSDGTVDQAEQLMGFEALLRAVDGRREQLNAVHIWQWGIDGAAGSNFYMDPNLSGNIGGGFDESLNTPAAQWLSNFAANPALDADFDDDLDFDCDDVDALVAEIAAASNNAQFDLTGDGLVTGDDLERWLGDAGAVNLPSGNAYLPGDANLDGFVDTSDFNVWNSNKLSSAAAWCRADFNADGVVDASDFNLWNSHKFRASDGHPASVPEPTASLLLTWLLFAVSVFRFPPLRKGGRLVPLPLLDAA